MCVHQNSSKSAASSGAAASAGATGSVAVGTVAGVVGGAAGATGGAKTALARMTTRRANVSTTSGVAIAAIFTTFSKCSPLLRTASSLALPRSTFLKIACSEVVA